MPWESAATQCNVLLIITLVNDVHHIVRGVVRKNILIKSCQNPVLREFALLFLPLHISCRLIAKDRASNPSGHPPLLLGHHRPSQGGDGQPQEPDHPDTQPCRRRGVLLPRLRQLPGHHLGWQPYKGQHRKLIRKPNSGNFADVPHFWAWCNNDWLPLVGRQTSDSSKVSKDWELLTATNQVWPGAVHLSPCNWEAVLSSLGNRCHHLFALHLHYKVPPMVSFLASSPLVTKEHLASLREVNINLVEIMTIVVVILRLWWWSALSWWSLKENRYAGDMWSGALRLKLDLPVYEKGPWKPALQGGLGHDRGPNQSYILDAFLKLFQGRRWCLQRGPVPQSPGAWQRQYRPPQLQVTPLQVCKLWEFVLFSIISYLQGALQRLFSP